MVKTKNGYTTLNYFCIHVNDHTRVAIKVKRLLEIGDANNVLSSTKSNGRTPLQFATARGIFNKINNRLTPQNTIHISLQDQQEETKDQLEEAKEHTQKIQEDAAQ